MKTGKKLDERIREVDGNNFDTLYRICPEIKPDVATKLSWLDKAANTLN